VPKTTLPNSSVNVRTILIDVAQPFPTCSARQLGASSLNAPVIQRLKEWPGNIASVLSGKTWPYQPQRIIVLVPLLPASKYELGGYKNLSLRFRRRLIASIAAAEPE